MTSCGYVARSVCASVCIVVCDVLMTAPRNLYLSILISSLVPSPSFLALEAHRAPPCARKKRDWGRGYLISNYREYTQGCLRSQDFGKGGGGLNIPCDPENYTRCASGHAQNYVKDKRQF